ncbi:hypothetical protein GCM10010233_18400 [Streptomyces pseudogriseolus]|nr:hypothetical protein GCM10010233_18400 [Streptomyces gancidicus]
MRKRMLRSVLVAAFSTVVAFGALSGTSDAQNGEDGDTVWSGKAGDTVWSSGAVGTGDGEGVVYLPADTIWS